jgi:hypothetical protein
MKSHYVLIAAAILCPYILWATHKTLQRVCEQDVPRDSVFAVLVVWLIILAAGVFGYLAYGVLGLIGTVAAAYLMPSTLAIVVAILTGRVRRV